MAHPERGISVAYNGYCWAGCTGDSATVSRQQIDGHDYAADYGGERFASTFSVYVTSDSAKTTEIAALQALTKPQGNLAVTKGKAVSWTDLVVSGTTISSVSGGFTAAMLGLPVNVRSKGTAQITAVTDANTVTVATAIGDGSGLTGWVGETIYRVIPSSRVGGWNLTTRVKMPQHPLQTGTRWVVTFEAEWQTDADSARGVNATNRSAGRVRVTYSASRLMRVEFSGTYKSSDSATARANYVAGFATWRDAVFAILTFGGAPTDTNYEEVEGGRAEDEDDYRNLLDFTRVYRELPRKQKTSAWDDPVITDLRLDLSRSIRYAHGKPGVVGAVHVTAAWSCAVIEAEKDYTEIVDYYSNTIKPYLLTEITARMGGSSIVILRETGPALASQGEENRVAGYLSVLVRGLGSDILRWHESYAYKEDKEYYFRKLHDGKPDTYLWWTPGATHICGVTITASVIGTLAMPKMTAARKKPPFALAAAGKWLPLDSSMSESWDYLGQDLDDATGVKVSAYRWSQSYLWVANEGLEPPHQRIPTGSVHRGGGTVPS